MEDNIIFKKLYPEENIEKLKLLLSLSNVSFKDALKNLEPMSDEEYVNILQQLRKKFNLKKKSIDIKVLLPEEIFFIKHFHPAKDNFLYLPFERRFLKVEKMVMWYKDIEIIDDIFYLPLSMPFISSVRLQYLDKKIEVRCIISFKVKNLKNKLSKGVKTVVNLD